MPREMDADVLEKGSFLQRTALGHQCLLPQTQEVTSFKVHLTAGVCPHHEVGVPLFWETCNQSPWVCPAGKLGCWDVGGRGGRQSHSIRH